VSGRSPGLSYWSPSIQPDPKCVPTYVNRARAYRLKGDIDRAIADHTQVIQLNPKFAAAYYNRDIAYRMTGDTDRAVADYRQGSSSIHVSMIANGIFV